MTQPYTREETIQRILDRQTSAMNLGFDWPEQSFDKVETVVLEQFLAEVQDFLDECAEASYYNRLEDMNG